MTDEQIKAWLAEHGPVDQYTWQNLADCLTELLAHRELHAQIKWAVWVKDQSAESGWTCRGWFSSEEEAQEYRFNLLDEPRMTEVSEPELLVLPANEVPSETAR